jgi:6-phosphogluconolactonase
VLPSPDGRFAYFVSLGADLIAQYAIADDLALVPLDPPTAAAPAGSGPRHLVIDDDTAPSTSDRVLRRGAALPPRHASGILGFAGSARLRRRPGSATRFGADPLAHHYIWGADLHLAGDRLWASERTESTLGSLAIAADGTLTDASRFTRTEQQPRGSR